MPEGAPRGPEGPDETKFNQMETAAAAGGPEAEARRHEMNDYAEAAGMYAENAARVNKEAADAMLAKGATHEEVHEHLKNTNETLGRYGTDNNGLELKPTDQGMKSRSWDGKTETYRSPAHINEPKENPEDKAA